MNNTLKIGIYLRSARNEESLLKIQKELLTRICHRNEWSYEVYEDMASAQNLNRTGLQQLRKDIEDRKIDAVMVYNLDRLSRNALQLLIIIQEYFLEYNMTKLYVQNDLKDLKANTLTELYMS